MAFKPIRNSDSTCAISIYDKAIDWDSMGDDARKKWAEESFKNPSCFREYAKVKTGETLTVFEIGVIPIDVLVRIADECQPVERKIDGKKMVMFSDEMLWRSFLAGVRDIQGWHEKPEKRMVDGVEYVDPSWLKKQFSRGLHRVAIDIGAHIWRWNNITEQEIKN